MDDQQILQRIHALIDEEHDLRSRPQETGVADRPERSRLTRVEQTLDQCWDLLRRRRALRQVGMNPNDAHPAPVSQVENYLQ